MKGSVIPDESSRGKKVMTTRKESVLDLSGKGLQNMTSLPKRYSTCDLILDHNSITKIEKLDAFPKLSLLSMMGNHLVRMNGVNFGKNLISVNLSNNGIVSMEGLCWLVHLEYLDLSKNNIKRIQNVSYCTKLKHMDLSENSITDISNLKSLVQLKVLFLHGNTITTLERAEENLPEQIETLSLSGNGISDLNEVRRLSCLLNLKYFSVVDNPCVMRTTSLPFQSGFDFRPFIVTCLQSLLTLDRSAVTDTERQNAERLSLDENLPLFTFGHHLQLVLYLSLICPVDNTTEVNKDQNNFLEDFLQERRMEIFSNQKSTEVTRNGFALSNDVYQSDVRDLKASDTLKSSSYSVLDFSENTQNGSGNFSLDEDSETDTLRSESRFLPVYSPLKKSPGTDRRRFQTSLSWEASPPDNVDDLPSMPDDLTNISDDLPTMTEEEANKLINLAATILQSHIRGFLVRRKFDYREYKEIHTAASKIQALWRGYYFRRYSNQGLNFKNELRVRRLQKYISTLCLVMQKSEKQHGVEKQQMLEIIALLYEKFTQLSEKVEKLESSSNEHNKMEVNDESRNRLEGTFHPVFSPHPRLSRNIEQSGNFGGIVASQDIASNSRGFPIYEDVGYCVKVDKDSEDVTGFSEDVDSINNKKVDKVSDDVTEFHVGQIEVDQSDFELAKEGIMEKSNTLMDEEDFSEWDKEVQKGEDGRVEVDKIMDQEHDSQFTELDKNSGKREDGMGSDDVEMDEDSNDATKWNGNEEGTNQDSYVYEASETPDDELSTNIPEDCTENETMTSEISELFLTGNVCELLETIQSDKKQRVEQTFHSIEGLDENYKAEDDFESLDQDPDSLGAGGTLNGRDSQVNELNDNEMAEKFDNGKLSCSNFEDDQELKREILTGECDKYVPTENLEIASEETIGINSVREFDTVSKDGRKISDKIEVLQQLSLEEVTPNTKHGKLECSLKVCSQVIDQKPISTQLTATDGGQGTEHEKGLGEGTSHGVLESQIAEHVLKVESIDNKVTEHVFQCTNVENKVADKVAEHEECSDDAGRQDEEGQHKLHVIMSIDPSKQRTTGRENVSDHKKYFYTNEELFRGINIEDNSSEDKTTEGDHGEHFGKGLTVDGGFVSKVDESIEATGHCVVEDTRATLGEEPELSYKNQDVVDKPTKALHGVTEERSNGPVDIITGESLKNSLDHTCSHEVDTAVGFVGDLEESISGEEIIYDNVDQSPAEVESKDSVIVNVESNMANVESNMTNMRSNDEFCNRLQNDEAEGPQSNTAEMDNTIIRANVQSDEESDSQNLEQETVTESTAVKKTSPWLRKRASSLLSALKDEITGVSSKDIQSEESLTSLPSATHTSGGDVCDAKDTEPGPTNDRSASETQEITDNNNFEKALKQNVEC